MLSLLLRREISDNAALVARSQYHLYFNRLPLKKKNKGTHNLSLSDFPKGSKACMTCGEAASRRLYPANLQLGLQAVEEGSARFAPPQFCHKLARATALEINLQGPHSTMATFPWPRLENELKNRTSLLVWQAVRTFSGVATFSFPVRERRSRTAKPQSGRHARGRPTAPAKCPCHPTGQETREYVSYHSYTLRNEVGFLSRQTQLLSTPLEERWVSAE